MSSEPSDTRSSNLALPNTSRALRNPREWLHTCTHIHTQCRDICSAAYAPRLSAIECRGVAGRATHEPHNERFVCASCLDSFAFAHCCMWASTPPWEASRPVDREKPQRRVEMVEEEVEGEEKGREIVGRRTRRRRRRRHELSNFSTTWSHDSRDHNRIAKHFSRRVYPATCASLWSIEFLTMGVRDRSEFR